MSFFRTPIDEKIQKELFKRVDSINFNNLNKNALEPVKNSVEHQFVKSCWARAAVVLADGKPKFLNSNLQDITRNGKLEPLNIKDGSPTRGRPGITSISANFKEYFIKQATINFLVPDPNDFDDFKNDFLKFGRYMIIEFGWSLPYNTELTALNADTILGISKDIQKRILSSDGNYNAIVGVVTNYNFSLTKEGAYEGTIEISSMGRNILGQTSSNDGKIENIIGYVNEELLKNKETGKYSVQTQVLENLRKTFVTFNAAIAALPDIVKNYVSQDNETKPFFSQKDTSAGFHSPVMNLTARFFNIEFKNTYNITTKPGVFYANGPDIIRHFDKQVSNEIVMVSWGWFEDFILNSFFSFVSEEGSDGDRPFRTEFFSGNMKQKPPTMGDIPPEGFSVYEQLKCRNHPDLYSLGFDSIILPGQTKEFSGDERFAITKDKTIYKGKSTGESEEETLERSRVLKVLIDKTNRELFQFDPDGEGKTGVIRNMYFNVDYLMESFGDFTENIEHTLNHFWQKVSNDYGGFWRFAITENPNIDGRLMVTDLNLGSFDDRSVDTKISTPEKPNQIYPFKVYSKNSIISDFSLESANDSEMATLAVYGSNIDLSATSADEGKGYQALAMRALSMIDTVYSGEENNTNRKIKRASKYDAILNNISNPIIGNFKNSGNLLQGTSATYFPDGRVQTRKRGGGIIFTNTPEVLQNTEDIEKELTDIDLFSIDEDNLRKDFYWPDKSNFNKVQIYSSIRLHMLDEFKRTMLYKINKAPGEDSNYSAVLPIVPLQLSLTLQGIGGIKIGDLFKIDYLPEKYRKYCHFMVVNVEHNIDTTGWTTKLDSRMIVDIPKLLKDDVSLLTKPLEVTPILQNLDTEIQGEINKLKKLNEAIVNEQRRKAFEEYYKEIEASGNLYNKKKPSLFAKRYDLSIPTIEQAQAEYDSTTALEAAND